MTKTFKIKSLQSRPTLNGLSDVVSSVIYTITAEDDGTTGIYTGHIELPTPVSGSFVEFSQLTEQQMITWVQSLTNQDRIDGILQEILFNEKYKPVNVNLPWVTGSL